MSKKIGLGVRGINLLIDSVTIFLISLSVLNFFQAEDHEYLAYIIIGVQFFYYLVLEATYGKTLGKMITKTKIVSTNGEDVPAHLVITRTLIRTVPFLNMLDAVSFLHTDKDGIHDRWTGTKLIRNS